jgi:outer membrane protein
MRHLTALLLCAVVLGPRLARANDLLDFYHQAQEQDTSLQAALHARDATVEARPQALAALLPQLTGSASIDRNRVHFLSGSSGTIGLPGPADGSAVSQNRSVTSVAYYTSKSYSLNLSQTLFDWSAFQTLAKANQAVAQAQASYRSAEQSLVYRLADAYFTLLYAQDTLKSDLDAQSSYQQQLEQAKKKFDVGLAAITDVRNAQASYDSASATVIADQIALDSARRALGLITGGAPDRIAQLQDEIPLIAPNPVSEEDWVKAAAQDNPDLMTAFYAAESARKDIAIYRGNYLPTVSAVGALNRQYANSNYGNNVIDQAVGLQLNWNIFQGGLTTSQVRQAMAGYQQQQSLYEGQRRTTEKAARDAYEGVISGIASVKANKQAVLSNQTSLEASQVGLRVGTRTQVDVLTAQQNLSAAQKTYFQARYAYLRSVLSLKQQAGRLSEADLGDIDALLQGR